ncbi:hypothetical protein HDU76_006991 [Blyttiomyces sp. JEL0837]|nr:hypothetical protein HDU76_006991 [Blyttiomyces sp. JEL0837]
MQSSFRKWASSLTLKEDAKRTEAAASTSAPYSRSTVDPSTATSALATPPRSNMPLLNQPQQDSPQQIRERLILDDGDDDDESDDDDDDTSTIGPNTINEQQESGLGPGQGQSRSKLWTRGANFFKAFGRKNRANNNELSVSDSSSIMSTATGSSSFSRFTRNNEERIQQSLRGSETIDLDMRDWRLDSGGGRLSPSPSPSRSISPIPTPITSTINENQNIIPQHQHQHQPRRHMERLPPTQPHHRTVALAFDGTPPSLAALDFCFKTVLKPHDSFCLIVAVPGWQRPEASMHLRTSFEEPSNSGGSNVWMRDRSNGVQPVRSNGSGLRGNGYGQGDSTGVGVGVSVGVGGIRIRSPRESLEDFNWKRRSVGAMLEAGRIESQLRSASFDVERDTAPGTTLINDTTATSSQSNHPRSSTAIEISRVQPGSVVFHDQPRQMFPMQHQQQQQQQQQQMSTSPTPNSPFANVTDWHAILSGVAYDSSSLQHKRQYHGTVDDEFHHHLQRGHLQQQRQQIQMMQQRGGSGISEPHVTTRELNELLMREDGGGDHEFGSRTGGSSNTGHADFHVVRFDSKDSITDNVRTSTTTTTTSSSQEGYTTDNRNSITSIINNSNGNDNSSPSPTTMTQTQHRHIPFHHTPSDVYVDVSMLNTSAPVNSAMRFISVDSNPDRLLQTRMAAHELRMLMRRVMEIYNGVSVNVVVHVVWGDRKLVVCEKAALEQAEVLILGTRGRTPMRGLMLGSTSRYVIEKCSVPVVVVRA